MPQNIIWVLGSRHENANKSILWNEPFPNFSNCDILLINLTTLDRDTLNKNSTKLSDEGRKYIFDLLMTGEKEVIVIVSPDQVILTWLPIFPTIRAVKSAIIQQNVVDSKLVDYMQTVENAIYYIHALRRSYMWDMVNPSTPTHENYAFTNKLSRGYLRKSNTLNIQNSANQDVGLKLRYELKGYTLGQGYYPVHNTGYITFLPPPTKTSAERAINKIINNLIGAELKESPPKWIKNVVIPNIDTIESTIEEKEKEMHALEKNIEDLTAQKNRKNKFLRLLWTRNFTLEEIVKDAFIFLGFSEIKKLREKNLEDWVIELQSIPDYDYGVFEVKGADKRTSLANLTQCNKWVDDYILKSKKAKGVFVTNQFRLEEMTDERRSKFEPNELEYAQTRNICILPSIEIFKAVIEKMRNNPDISRNSIEEKIASAKGLCKIV